MITQRGEGTVFTEGRKRNLEKSSALHLRKQILHRLFSGIMQKKKRNDCPVFLKLQKEIENYSPYISKII